MARTK
jgi:hypothetical protein